MVSALARLTFPAQQQAPRPEVLGGALVCVPAECDTMLRDEISTRHTTADRATSRRDRWAVGTGTAKASG